MFALFCGLVPYSWVERLALPSSKKNAADKKKADRAQLHSNTSSFDEAKLSTIATAIKAG